MTRLMQLLNKLEWPMPGERTVLREPMVSIEMEAGDAGRSLPHVGRYRAEARFGTDLMLRSDAGGAELVFHLKNIRRQISDAVYGEVRTALVEMFEPIYKLRRSRDREVWDVSDDLLNRIHALLEETKP